jgi:uncharacterized protein
VRATVRLYGELGDFVAPTRRGRAFDADLGGRRSVKDFVEALGVPHCEVFLVLVDGTSVGFDHLLTGGERVAVFPHFAELDVPEMATAGEPLPREPRFVLDGHLGRLAAYLRAMGFDVAHDRDADDATIARIAAEEDRVVLTRDLGLLKRSIVRHGRFVRATAPREQAIEIVSRFRLADLARPFTRCLACNEPLVAATREAVAALVPDGVLGRFDEFVRCAKCDRAFWRGTHHERLSHAIEAILAASR